MLIDELIYCYSLYHAHYPRALPGCEILIAHVMIVRKNNAEKVNKVFQFIIEVDCEVAFTLIIPVQSANCDFYFHRIQVLS